MSKSRNSGDLNVQTRIGLATAKDVIASVLRTYAEGDEVPQALALAKELARFWKLSEALELLNRASI